jgi:sulfatase modifying factor 1
MRRVGVFLAVISLVLAACANSVGSGSGAAARGSSGSNSSGSSGPEGDGSSEASSNSIGSGIGSGGSEAGSGSGSNSGVSTSRGGMNGCTPGGAGLTNCGATSESCCTSLPVTGGMYDRTYANDGTGATGPADPAVVSNFNLDKYLVTVGRFRQFVLAWNGGAGYTPSPGAGKHTHLNCGSGLNAAAGAYEPGWVAMDDSNIAPTTANLTCGGASTTWTSSASTQENLPINCVNWWEAYAFCIWDGGFLPSEAEWEYAAAGGGQQLEYPWGATDPGSSNEYAIYEGDYSANSTDIAPVGTATLGAALWGQLDMAGELWEWNVDWYAPYGACADCAELSAASTRVIRGGDFGNYASNMLPSFRDGSSPAGRAFNLGFRCARSAP